MLSPYELLWEVQQFIRKVAHESGGALIPPGRTYRQQYKHVAYRLTAMGMGGLHARRHEFARNRYAELVKEAIRERRSFPGNWDSRYPEKPWLAPVDGGPKSSELTGIPLLIDQWARAQTAEYLGHGRMEITRFYLG